MKRDTDYTTLAAQVAALTEGIPYEVANFANAAAAIWEAMEDINWAGFYKMVDGALVLYPFQGKSACIRIPVGKGVCGTAVEQDAIQLVADVHQFPGHIACDSASNSEIVLPIHKDGAVWAFWTSTALIFPASRRKTGMVFRRSLRCWRRSSDLPADLTAKPVGRMACPATVCMTFLKRLRRIRPNA